MKLISFYRKGQAYKDLSESVMNNEHSIKENLIT